MNISKPQSNQAIISVARQALSTIGEARFKDLKSFREQTQILRGAVSRYRALNGNGIPAELLFGKK